MLFLRVPLEVEVWQKDRQMSQNSCLGVAEVSLAAIFKSQKLKTVVNISHKLHLFVGNRLDFSALVCNVINVM